ncbi:MAG: multiheme c-type cytochrome [Verrucomicrobiota bacterium]
MSGRAAFILLLVELACLPASAKEPRQMRESRSDFIGAVGCKSSSCHGGAGPKRSQYITWSQHDFHTKAYAVLINSRSTRIAETLGFPEAQSSARCTVCHSPLQSVASSRLSRTAHPDEGVSCESCHGAAGGWLRGHTRADWTYRTRVAAGMRDLRDLYVRANACVACHQNLAPELLSAGHPDLFFELDGQSVAEPKHWRDEEPWSGLRQWLTGQAVALREMSWALAKNPPADELSITRWNALAWLCATATATGNIPSPISPPTATPDLSDFTRAQNEADALARRAATANWNETSARTLLAALASLDEEFADKKLAPNLLAQRAKRLVLALDRLTSALNQEAGVPLKAEAEMNQLFQDVNALYSFDATGFAGHLQNLRAALPPSR